MSEKTTTPLERLSSAEPQILGKEGEECDTKTREAQKNEEFPRTEKPCLGARLRGRTATQRSKKGSEKVLERVLGKCSQKGSENGVCYGFYSTKGF